MPYKKNAVYVIFVMDTLKWMPEETVVPVEHLNYPPII
jgi:hypothetical protein